MFVKNWYKVFSVHMTGKTTTFEAESIRPLNQLGDTLSVGISKNYAELVNTMMVNAFQNYNEYTLASTPGVMFGTSNTPVTLDDYKLSGSVLNQQLTASVSTILEPETEKCRVKIIYTLTNTSSESVTINEVGMFTKPASSAGYLTIFMIERTVLDAPVTIEPSGVGQVVYNIDINYPTA